MAKSCVYKPKRGIQLSDKLDKEFGKKVGVVVFNKTTTDYFIDRFRDSLELDAEGIPTYDSLLKIPVVRSYIGEENILNSVQRQQEVISDNLDNVKYLMNKAAEFNEESQEYVALVDFEGKENITLRIHPRTKELVEEAKRQQSVYKLNEKIEEILQPLGIPIGTIHARESAVGRIGVTEFKRSLDNAKQFEVLIKVANGLEGFGAISEEFSHTVIGLLHNTPLVQRAIQYMSKERHAQQVLGDQYQDVYDFYSGDTLLIAEEAVGHVFRDILMETPQQREQEQRPSLLKRMFNFIVRLFKRFNPYSYHNDIEVIRLGLQGLAKDIISGRTKLTEQDIQDAQRQAVFNALSERGEIQVKVLKAIVERAYKASALVDSLEEQGKGEIEEKSVAQKFAQDLEEVIKGKVEKEETVAAIAAYIQNMRRLIKEQWVQLTEKNLETKNIRDKFTILRNALNIINQVFPSIDELLKVTTYEFMNDSEIATQAFMLEDFENKLSPYEDTDSAGISFIDLSNKTPDEAIAIIERESSHFSLSQDESHYNEDRKHQKSMRVTEVIKADEGGARDNMPEGSPWITPSTNIGTGIDEFIRDCIAGKIYLNSDGNYKTVEGNKNVDEVYPNASLAQLNMFAKQIMDMKEKMEAGGLILYPRNIIASGTINTVDGNGNVHTVRVSGTIDLLAYDKTTGTYVLYDFKTHRGDISPDKVMKWRRQLTLYKNFLEAKYNIKISKIGIIPIKVGYPTPKGAPKGTAVYNLSTEPKPEEYNGKYNNQITLDGTPYKNASPTLEDIIEVDKVSLNIIYSRLADDPTDGIGNTEGFIQAAVGNLRTEAKLAKDVLMNLAKKEFLKFLVPIIGKTLRIPNPKDKTKMMEVPIEHILEKADQDVTFMQKWFTSMADNPDALLQIFDQIYKRNMDIKRQNVKKVIDRIQVLGIKYEKLGVREYSWLYEEDNRNYINKIYNRAAYNKAKKAKIAELNSKYGQFAQSGSPESKAWNQEWKAWLEENTITTEIDSKPTQIPNPAKYPSTYSKLDSAAQHFYDEWMAIKEELDTLLGPKKTWVTNTIKIRRKGIERLKTSFSGEAITNMINSAKADFLRSFDDDITYAKESVRSIRDFDGREVMKLPLFFIGRARNADYSDISHDAISTLMAYADMAYTYDALNEIVNPLEIGRELARQREIKDTRGGLPLKEIFKRRGGELQKNDIVVNTEASEFMDLLNIFFESKIYGRYMEDNDTITKAKIDTNKLASRLTKLGASVQLGFNALAHIANLLTGIGMTNIEAVAGEFFTAKKLAKADKEFMKCLPAYMKDIGKRVNKSKLALFMELFDVKQNFSSKIKDKSFLNKTWLGQIFGPRLQFLGQDAGDIYLYGRIAIAMALSYEMIITDSQGNTKKTNLWECLTTVPIDTAVPEAGNKLVLQEGALKTDNTPFSQIDVSKFSGNIRYLTQHLFGIYNTEDQIAVRRKILGRFIMQYRDWIPTALRYRFGKRTTNLEKQNTIHGGEQLFQLSAEVEGYYRTFGRFMYDLGKELRHGSFAIHQVWDDLDDYDRKNVRRAVGEIVQFGIVLLIVGAFGALKDRKDIWGDKNVAPLTFFQRLLRYASYIATREKTELGVLIPLHWMPLEAVKIAKSPAAATNVLSSIGNLFNVFWIPNYFDEIEGGYYKGHSTAFRAFMESPLTLWFKTIRRVLNPETAESYYAKN